MRGTLHVLPAAEWRTWVAVLRTREWRITPGWVKYHGITKAELDAVTEAIPEALAGDPLTRDELADRVAATTGHAHLGEQLRSGWAAVFKPAANRGLLCQGPPRRGNITFTDPERWLGTAGGTGPDPDPDEAMAAVLARFLDAYGPATREDLARWLGVTPKAARLALAAHADEPGRGARRGTRGMDDARRARPRPPRPARPRACTCSPGSTPTCSPPSATGRTRSRRGASNGCPAPAGWISPVLLVDGRIAGTWEPEVADGVTTVTITPFARLPAPVVRGARAHLEQRYAAVLGPDLRLAVA